MLQIETRTGADIEAIADDLARLRINVFRDWPYLYNGSMKQERSLVLAMAKVKHFVVVVARDGDTIVGSSSAAPMGDQVYSKFCEPLRSAGVDIDKTFYFIDTLLLREHRGSGFGRVFSETREEHVRSIGGFEHIAFCAAAERQSDHPMADPNYVPLDGFWVKRGYRKVNGATYESLSAEVGPGDAPKKVMQFWLKDLT